MSVSERARFEMATHAYPLTPRGERQADITGEYIRKTYGNFDIRYVSYYLRSRQTMGRMFPNEKVYEDPRLAEAQRGIWHTMTADQIEKVFPYEKARKEREGLYHFRPLGGENWPDIELRIHSFLGTLSRDYEDQTVIIVVHGHWLILFQRLVEHFSIDEAIDRYKNGPFENASVTVYEGRKIKKKSRLIKVCENVVPWQGVL